MKSKARRRLLSCPLRKQNRFMPVPCNRSCCKKWPTALRVPKDWSNELKLSWKPSTHGLRNELGKVLSTTLGGGKKTAPGLHSIRVEDAIVLHLPRGPLWCLAQQDIHLGSSRDVPVPSLQADHEGIKRGSGQHLVAHRVSMNEVRLILAH